MATHKRWKSPRHNLMVGNDQEISMKSPKKKIYL